MEEKYEPPSLSLSLSHTSFFPRTATTTTGTIITTPVATLPLPTPDFDFHRPFLALPTAVPRFRLLFVLLSLSRVSTRPVAETHTISKSFIETGALFSPPRIAVVVVGDVVRRLLSRVIVVIPHSSLFPLDSPPPSPSAVSYVSFHGRNFWRTMKSIREETR